MKVKRFKIPLYEYHVTLVEIVSKKDADKLPKVLSRVKINKDDIEEEVENVKKGKYNGGMTYRNNDMKEYLIILYPSTSENKRLNILGHEKRHIEDRLAEHTYIEGMEAMAYLAGFLTEKLFAKTWNQFS